MLRGLFNIIIYLFHKDRQFFFSLVRILGFIPVRISLYKTAFTHKSASLTMSNGNRINNERLEYLGDALLGAIVADYLFRKYDNSNEGFMTKLRARIVKRKQLDATAIKMGLPIMINSKDLPLNIPKHLYGNALEALIGAIYLDRGFSKAKLFFSKRMVNRHIDLAKLAKKDSDYKSQLIEWAQKNKKGVLFESYEGKKSSEGMPVFISNLRMNGELLGTGTGNSKKDAEQHASMKALEVISN